MNTVTVPFPEFTQHDSPQNMAGASLIRVELHMVPLPNVKECVRRFSLEGHRVTKGCLPNDQSLKWGLKGFFQKQGNKI